MKAMRRIGFCIAVAGLGFGVPAARADIDEGLETMFMTTGQEPSVYESQRRGGVNMGTFRMRSPISTVNVLNLTAPEVRAGCGGIDLYGGSFTFINTEQFRQILRQIGANALGYAFKLALATMCQECDKILTGLQDMMNDLTNMNVDSCRWAQGLVNDAAKAMNLNVNQEAMTEATARGEFEDMIDAAQGWFANAGRFIKNGSASGADPAKKDVGNLTWNALRIAGTAGLFNYGVGNINHNEVLMNMAGSFILRSPTDAEAGAGREGDMNGPVASRLTFAELKRGKVQEADGDGDASPMLRCDEQAQCLNPATVAKWSFGGIDGWVQERLTTIADHMRNPATAGDPHDPADIAFLGAVPIDVTRHLVELQGSPGLDKYVAVAGEYLAASYAVALGETMVAAIEAAYERQDTPAMPESVRANLGAFKKEVAEERLRVGNQYVTKLIEIEQLVDDLQVPNRSRPATLSTKARD